MKQCKHLKLLKIVSERFENADRYQYTKKAFETLKNKIWTSQRYVSGTIGECEKCFLFSEFLLSQNFLLNIIL